MSNVLAFPLRPTTETGRRALTEARKHRKRALIWLMSKLGEHESEYTRTQALAVLHAWRLRKTLTADGARWLAIMSVSFDERSRGAAVVIREELTGRKTV